MDAMSDLKWFIFIIIGFWLLWFFTGGPDRATSQGGIFITPLNQTGSESSGGRYGSISSFNNDGDISGKSGVRQPLGNISLSIFRDVVSINDINGAFLSDPQTEFIELRAGTRNLSGAPITGWKFINSSGQSSSIGQATEIPYISRINVKDPLVLLSGEKAIVTTGRSPVGISFRANKCSGYFEQFQDFNPPIKKECPSPLSGVDTDTYGLERACIAYIKNIPRCEVNTGDIPENLSSQCSLFINSQINHNTCVDKHKEDNDFTRREWRVFLGESSEFWANDHESIKLVDLEEKIVDVVNY